MIWYGWFLYGSQFLEQISLGNLVAYAHIPEISIPSRNVRIKGMARSIYMVGF
jgi:hypothetical protein